MHDELLENVRDKFFPVRLVNKAERNYFADDKANKLKRRIRSLNVIATAR